MVFNQVPKQFAQSDIYCQLVQNYDDNNPYYDVVPRTGAFEISYNGVVSANETLTAVIAYLLETSVGLLAQL